MCDSVTIVVIVFAYFIFLFIVLLTSTYQYTIEHRLSGPQFFGPSDYTDFFREFLLVQNFD